MIGRHWLEQIETVFFLEFYSLIIFLNSICELNLFNDHRTVQKIIPIPHRNIDLLFKYRFQLKDLQQKR